jgi:hypothetical protein
MSLRAVVRIYFRSGLRQMGFVRRNAFDVEFWVLKSIANLSSNMCGLHIHGRHYVDRSFVKSCLMLRIRQAALRGLLFTRQLALTWNIPVQSTPQCEQTPLPRGGRVAHLFSAAQSM